VPRNANSVIDETTIAFRRRKNYFRAVCRREATSRGWSITCSYCARHRQVGISLRLKPYITGVFNIVINAPVDFVSRYTHRRGRHQVYDDVELLIKYRSRCYRPAWI